MYDYKSSNALKLNNLGAEHSVSEKSVNKTGVKTETAPAKKTGISVGVAVKRFAMVIAAFAAAFFIVRGYVAINEAENRITALKNELRTVEAENQSIKAKIDKSIDLKNLQSIASEKFGMVRPENYQVFYIDLDFDDYSEKTAAEKKKSDKPDIPIESVTGVLISSANMFR